MLFLYAKSGTEVYRADALLLFFPLIFKCKQYMWEFALLALACVPVMGAATSVEMKQMLGEDEGVETVGGSVGHCASFSKARTLFFDANHSVNRPN